MRINANNAQTEQIKSIKLNNEALLDNLTKGRSQYNITDNSNQKYAAVMKISQEGTNKQQGMNLEKDNEGEIKLPSNANVRTIDSLMEAAKNNEALSEAEESQLNVELQRSVELQYQKMTELRLSEDDERVQEALKNHFLMKQRTLLDMQKELEQKNSEGEMTKQQAESAENAHEIAERTGEAQMLQQSLDYLNEEENVNNFNFSEQNQQGNQQDETDSQQTTDTNVTPFKNVIKESEKNKENLDQIKNQKDKDVQLEREYSALLDEHYQRTMETVQKEDVSLKDKVKAYEDFTTASKEFAVNRELERHRKMFDFEAIVDVKIAGASIQNGMDIQDWQEQQKKYMSKNNLKNAGQNFIKAASKNMRNINIYI